MPEDGSFSVRFGFSNMKFDQVTMMLERAFWCEGIKQSEVEKGSRNSALVVGAFDPEGRQVGFARAISDKTRFAYILDVIVREDRRKEGIGRLMIRSILDHDELRDVYQWALITKDAHEVYRKLGFSEVGRPHDWMEIRKARPDR